mgnify:CR=1 FL=1
MSEPRFKTYGLNSEPESRIEQEFDAIHKGKLDFPLDKKVGAPNPTTVAQGKPVLVKDGAVWYIYIRIEDSWHRVALTAV